MHSSIWPQNELILNLFVLDRIVLLPNSPPICIFGICIQKTNILINFQWTSYYPRLCAIKKNQSKKWRKKLNTVKITLPYDKNICLKWTRKFKILVKGYFHIKILILVKYMKKNMHIKNHSFNISTFSGSTKYKLKNSNNQPASLLSNIVALKVKHN